MSIKLPSTSQRGILLTRAAADFFFLQNRIYPRKAALEWVGNRYELTHLERQFLHRGVFSQAQALLRRAKRCLGSDWENQWLVVDGHNVQITVESALLDRPLLKGNDGALRDVAGLSASFRMSEATEVAADMIFRFLEEFRPEKVTFLFDAPMSHSGELAQAYRCRLQRMGIPGEARAIPVPEREFPYRQCVVASSDQAVLNESLKWIDLANRVLSLTGPPRAITDFSNLLVERELACSPCLDLPLPFLSSAGDH